MRTSTGRDEYAALTNICVDTKAFQTVSAELRDDPKFVSQVLEIDPSLLEFAGPTVKRDRSIVTATVARQGTQLGFASEELRDEDNVVLTAIKNDERAFSFARML